MNLSNFFRPLCLLTIISLSFQTAQGADSWPEDSKQKRERIALMKEFGVNASAVKSFSSRSKNTGSLGYMILGVGDTQDILFSLETHNDTDVLTLGRPPFSGRISLGVYNSLESAQRRRDTLATYAVNAEIIDRKTSEVLIK